jgi:hypothetical protein
MTPPTIGIAKPTDVADIQKLKAFFNLNSFIITGKEQTSPENRPQKTPEISKLAWKLFKISHGFESGATSQDIYPANNPANVVSRKNNQFKIRAFC